MKISGNTEIWYYGGFFCCIKVVKTCAWNCTNSFVQRTVRNPGYIPNCFKKTNCLECSIFFKSFIFLAPFVG